GRHGGLLTAPPTAPTRQPRRATQPPTPQNRPRPPPHHLGPFSPRLEAEGLAPATVLQIHRILSRALKVAMQRGYVTRNVATLVDARSASHDEVEPLTLDEALRILRLAATQRNGTRWSVALALGLRQGEALGLRWRHVDLDAGTLTIRWQLQRLPWRHGCSDPHACGKDRHRDDCGPGCARHARSCPQRTGGGLHLTELKPANTSPTIPLPPHPPPPP